MTILTVDYAKTLPTQELHSIVWDLYRDLNGTRPYHIDLLDREAMISFIEYESRPDTIKKRQQQWEKEMQMLENSQHNYKSTLEDLLEVEKELANYEIDIKFSTNE